MRGVIFTIVSSLFFSFSLSSQIDAQSVMGLPQGTSAEINAITPAQDGAIAYASDIDKILMYTGSAWRELMVAPNTYMGVFVITATGNQTISGLPFRPSQISFAAHANVESLNLDSDNGVGNNNSGIANAYGSANGFARDDGGSITQQTIYVGGSGNSINDISRYASSSHCIGIRYSNQNGNSLGLTTATLTSFNADGFTINVDNRADNLVVLFQAHY